jgi:hypothetical protein
MGLTSAQTPPLGSKEDNACNPGGAMEGKCGNDPWDWACGWYLARWQSNGGWLTPNNPFNDACLSLLPPRPAPDTAVSNDVITICRTPIGFPGLTYCLSSDQTGTFSGPFDALYLFTNAAIPGGCPLTYGGLPLNGSAVMPDLFTFVGFSLTELFTTLGLAANVCIYI